MRNHINHISGIYAMRNNFFRINIFRRDFSCIFINFVIYLSLFINIVSSQLKFEKLIPCFLFNQEKFLH